VTQKFGQAAVKAGLGPVNLSARGWTVEEQAKL
jgi:hypothetical protein